MEKQIDDLIEKLERLKGLYDRIKTDRFLIRLDRIEGTLVFHTSKAAELSEIRHHLRTRLGVWEDRVGIIWWCFGPHAEWKPTSYDWPIRIRFHGRSEDDLPEGILKEGCHFEEVVEKAKRLVCPS